MHGVGFTGPRGLIVFDQTERGHFLIKPHLGHLNQTPDRLGGSKAKGDRV